MKPSFQRQMRALVLLLSPLLLASAVLPTVNGGGRGATSKAPRITLDLRDTDVRDALRLVARQGGINLVLGKGVEGAVTLQLDDVTIEETLEAISEVAGLHHTFHGGYAGTGRLVTVNTHEEVLAKEEEAKLQAPPREALVVHLQYVDAERMLSVLKDVLSAEGTIARLDTSDHVVKGAELGPQQQQQQQLLGQNAGNGQEAALQIGTQLLSSTQGVPARSHTLVVVDTPDRLREVQRVVNEIDRKPVQVLIEARFVEVTLSDNQQLGVDWNVMLGASGAAAPHTFPFGNSSLGEFNPNVVGGSGGVFPQAPNSVTSPMNAGLFTFGTLDFSTFTAILEAIRNDSSVEMVSNPHIVVGDRHTATILVGERYPILSANISEFGTVTEQLERYEPIGVQLEVTPSVLNDDEIELFVRPSTSSLGGLVTGSTGINVVRINSRQIDTSVTVKDQQTVVLGGLITTRESVTTSSVPFLGSIPGLDRLFSSERRQTERVDLVVFLTVALVRESDLTPDQQRMFDETGPGVIGQGPANAQDAQRAALAYTLTPPAFKR